MTEQHVFEPIFGEMKGETEMDAVKIPPAGSRLKASTLDAILVKHFSAPFWWRLSVEICMRELSVR